VCTAVTNFGTCFETVSSSHLLQKVQISGGRSDQISPGRNKHSYSEGRGDPALKGAVRIQHFGTQMNVTRFSKRRL
jgi:hypothetical protein